MSIRGRCSAVEHEPGSDLVFLSIGIHEFPMNRDEARALAHSLLVAADDNVENMVPKSSKRG
jgi:hypothetical protein